MFNEGLIIFLNGTSSSGKTTISRELTRRLFDYEYMGIDDHLPRDQNLAYQLQKQDAQGILKAATDAVYAFHNSIASKAATGRNVIVDHVLQNPDWAEHAGITFEPYPVLFVGVYCPIDVAIERERERGDRINGTVQCQFHVVHANILYDLTVDTSILTPWQCADRIIHAIDHAEYAHRSTREKFAARRESQEL